MEVFAVQNYGYLITINKLSSDNSACSKEKQLKQLRESTNVDAKL